MNRRTSAVLSIYTGFLLGPFDAMQAYAEELLGRPVWTHELGSQDLVDQLKALAKPELERICEAVSALAPELWESARDFTDEQYAEGVAASIAAWPEGKPVVVVGGPESTS